MFLKKILGQPAKREIIDKGNGGAEKSMDIVESVKTAFFQISSVINEKTELDAILEVIARESLKCLKAQRSTIFLVDEKSGILKTQFAYTPEPLNEQVSLFEEKEVARKVLKQRKSFLLREAKDFSEFFKYGERERKITSLMSIPLYCRGNPIRVHSVALMNEQRSFTEQDLQLLLIFGNHASIAMEIAQLKEEVNKGADIRKNYERHLDNVLDQLQSLSNKERQRIEGHIEKLLPQQQAHREMGLATPQIDATIESVRELLALNSALSNNGSDNGPQENQAEQIPPMQPKKESLSFGEDFNRGGAFIRTANPMELGEHILLRLQIPDGQETVELTCKVIWTNKYGKESKHLRRGMGVKFLNLCPEVKKRVEKCIQFNQNKELSPEYWSISVVDPAS